MTSAFATHDKNKFISGLTQRYTTYLCVPEFLACLDKNKIDCVNSVKAATSECPVDNFYKTTILGDNAEKTQIKELKKEGYLFGNCVSTEFFKKLSVSEITLKSCERLLLEPAK